MDIVKNKISVGNTAPALQDRRVVTILSLSLPLLTRNQVFSIALKYHITQDPLSPCSSNSFLLLFSGLSLCLSPHPHTPPFLPSVHFSLSPISQVSSLSFPICPSLPPFSCMYSVRGYNLPNHNIVSLSLLSLVRQIFSYVMKYFGYFLL